NHIACHNYWHMSLFNVSLDRFEEAATLFDNEILPRVRASPQQSLGSVDGSSLLYRLSLINRDKFPQCGRLGLDRKFNEVYSITRTYIKKHLEGFLLYSYIIYILIFSLGFIDSQLLMTY